MNVLSFVFSILFLLTFAFYACIHRQILTHKIQKTFDSQNIVRRKLAASYEGEVYKAIQTMKKNETEKKTTSSKTPKQKKEKKKEEIPKINPECAKLNLWPLLEQIQKDKKDEEENPELYEKAAHLFRLFYQKPLLSGALAKERSEYRFLDEWIACMKEELLKERREEFVLEKIAFKDKTLQALYYNMLRGAETEYPSLLDLVKVKNPKGRKEKLCLLHATPAMISIFFGEAAAAVYEEMHSETLAVTKERIDELCRLHHHPIQNKDVFDLLNLSRFKHPEASEITLLEEDEESKITLRKKVQKPK